MYDITGSWTTLDHVQNAGTAVGSDQHLFEAMQAIRFERGDTSASLALPIDQVAAIHPAIAANRIKVDNGLSAALASLEQIHADGLPAIISRLKAAYQEQVAVRSLVENAYKLAPEARDTTLRGKVLQTGDHLTSEIEGAVRRIETEIRRLEPDLSALINVKNFSWTARLSTGDSVIMVNTALSTRKPWTPAEVMGMHENQVAPAHCGS